MANVRMWAHSANADGERHEWAAHADGTARLAAEFAGEFGMAEHGRLLGLWHDVGKLAPDWQRYLAGSEAGRVPRGSGPDHKAAGAQLARRLGEHFSLVLYGHHGGLSAPEEVKGWLADRLVERGDELRRAAEAARDLLGDRFNPGDGFGRGIPGGIADGALRSELLLRMLFSCLVDADWLDTEAHFSPERSGARAQAAPDLAELQRRFKDDQRGVTGGEGAVNEARDAIYDACLDAAERPPGFFRLTVPTGGGKTRSGMAFALRHALRHGQRRVIVAVPFTSITEQTASAYRGIFERPGDGAPAVLEHHSNASDPDGQSERWREPQRGIAARPRHNASDPDGQSERWARLAAENWDAPIVVTTTVQLFESLFANRPGRMRKLHRLANSVLILDEAQALPRKFLAPILDALRGLVEHYGATVVLSTATQPAFEVIPEFGDVDASEIVLEPRRWFEGALRRVEYERPPAPLAWDDVARRMLAEPGGQALAIVNTKRDALALLGSFDEQDAEAFHLSTLLCGAHRRDVLDEVRRRLDAGEPCLLVSTQVVEAGVDIDFPFVLRAVGPLDSIAQAAGRCNRNGRMPEQGRVVVFEPAEPSPLPPGYRQPTEAGRIALAASGPHARPDDPDVQRRYFEGLLGLTDADGEGVQPLRERCDFPEVAKRFRMIDPTIPVVVRYGDEAHVAELIARARESARTGRGGFAALRALQPYVVPFYARQMREHGALLSEIGGTGAWEWLGCYDGGIAGRGVVLERLSVDDFVQ